MAAADALIVRDGPVAAPLDYVVPNGSAIVPSCVTARFDGSGAATPFIPALVFKSPDGHVVAFCPLAESVVAGGSADVSFFPGVSAQSSAAFATGAWTQVFHYDVPALGAPTVIDTLGSTWSSNANSIFGLFMGQSATGAHNEELWLRVNGDGLGHYGYGYQYGNAYIGGTPGVFGSGGNVLDVHGGLGLIGGVGDTLGFTAIQFWIPQVYQSSETGKIAATGGYAGLVSGVQQVAITSYEFSTITRLELFTQTAKAFKPGSSLTLWAV